VFELKDGEWVLNIADSIKLPISYHHGKVEQKYKALKKKIPGHIARL
jgi:hypothetical protein